MDLVLNTGKQLQLSANILSKEITKHGNMVIDNEELSFKLANDEKVIP